MRHCAAASKRLQRFDGHGGRYVDDVRAWQTDEPALDMTGAAIIAAAAELGIRPGTPVGGETLLERTRPMRPGTPRMLRGINDRAALDLLLEHGPLSRTRLGELTGLSKPTSSQLLSRLETAGLVVASGSSRRRSRSARPAVRREPAGRLTSPRSTSPPPASGPRSPTSPDTSSASTSSARLGVQVRTRWPT